MPAVTATAVAPWSADALEALVAARNEPVWVAERRRAAYETYIDLCTRELDPEEWKRIDLRAFRPEKFSLRADAAAETTFATLMADRGEFGGVVSHVDGVCRSATLDPALAAKGVIFGSLTQVIQEHGELLKARLLAEEPADRFAALHAAFWTGGAVLYVPRGVEIAQPLSSLIGLTTDGAADLSHTLVILEEGASATLLEETVSANPTAAGLHVGSVQLLLAPGSRLRYVQLQNWNQKTWHFARQSGHIGRDAFLQWTVGGLGARLAHINQQIHLDGRGAQAEVNGVTFATDRQLISYYTQQTHHAPDTRSDLLYKDVLRDRARVVWRGMIKVDKDAQQTDGYQRNDGLMMSDHCRVDAIPGLEIEADDVRCTHGATVGRVDEEQLFYCMCRGLARQEAMHMIVEGFFQRVYDRIPVELVRETLSQAVERKLGLGE